MNRQVPMFGLVLLLLLGCAANQPIGKQWDATKRADVGTQLAIGYMQRNQLEIAREELEHALEIAPDHSGANHAMAALQEKLGNHKAAESHYLRALSSDAENSQAAHDYATFLCRRGRVEDAMNQYQKALSNPLYRQPEMTNLRAGECLMFHEDIGAAESYFKNALRINPRIAPALYHMANINYLKNNYFSARGFIERHFAVAAKTPKSLLLAYKIESQLKAPEVAEQYATLLRSEFSTSREAKELEKLLRERK